MHADSLINFLTEIQEERDNMEGELSYEKWAVSRLSESSKCKLENSMACIPLREDPLCRGCFEAVKAAQNRSEGIKERPKVCTDACINDEVTRLQGELTEAKGILKWRCSHCENGLKKSSHNIEEVCAECGIRAFLDNTPTGGK